DRERTRERHAGRRPIGLARGTAILDGETVLDVKRGDEAPERTRGRHLDVELDGLTHLGPLAQRVSDLDGHGALVTGDGRDEIRASRCSRLCRLVRGGRALDADRLQVRQGGGGALRRGRRRRRAARGEQSTGDDTGGECATSGEDPTSSECATGNRRALAIERAAG